MAYATLTFLGAAGTVTGSKYLLNLGDRRVLIDGGMFQGEKQWRERNWDAFPVKPSTISDLVLTHAHADHSAYIPALVKAGFKGTIWCTKGTRMLVEIVLRDSAHLQEQEALEANEGGYSKHSPALPLYTTEDVEKTLPLIKVVPFDTPVDLGGGLTVLWVRAGHILGSASVLLQYGTSQVLFSGDLGRSDHPILKPRETPPGAPFVMIESTYGDRDHAKPENLPHEAMADAIRRTIERGGSVLIPAFAIDRTELVLKTLAEMRRDGRIPQCPIWVNSPMALAALDAYRAQPEEIRDDVHLDEFANLADLHESRSTDESKKLTDPANKMAPSIIISSSGMATGGRVVHHLAAMAPDPKNAVVLTGYQAVGTRGRMLLDGVKQLKMFGKYVPVKCEIVQDSEFSVHADASSLIAWLRDLKPAPQTVFVTHGEEGSAENFAAKIRSELGFTAVVPKYKEVVSLDAVGGGYQVLEPGVVGSTIPHETPSPAAEQAAAAEEDRAASPMGAAAAAASAASGWTRGDGTTAGAKATEAAAESGPAEASAEPTPAAAAGPSTAGRQRYRLLTAPDDAKLAELVSQALDDGYELYGNPTGMSDGKQFIVAQAVTLPR